jgi:exodeoxyribonuclease-3
MTRLVTWNVNSLRARIEKVLSWINQMQPDILCLQETKLTDKAFLEYQKHFDGLGFFCVHHGNSHWNGVAVISKEPLVKVTDSFPNNPLLNEARILHVITSGLNIVNVYVPNGREVGSEHFTNKLLWLDGLIKYLQSQDLSTPFVVCGDFNIAPSSLDVWDEKQLQGSTHITVDERKKVQELINLGFKDVFRELHPEDKLFSWWDYRGGSFHQNKGLRIDLVFANKAVVKKIKDVFIDRQARKNPTPSDHAPVILDLKD